MPTSQVAAYPAVKDIFTRELKRLTKQQRSDFPQKIHKTRSTFFNYRNGIRSIPPDVLQAIVEALRNDPKGQGDLRRELEAALSFSVAGKNLLEDIKEGRPLEVTTIANYTPISGAPTAFFDRFANRFSDLVGLPFHPQPRPMLQGDLQQSKFNSVLMALFDSPDRMLHLRFFRFPLRMTLGAVTDQDYLTDANISKADVALVMSDPSHKSLIKRGIRPIVVTGEVGYINCRNRLRFASLSEVSALNVEYLVERLDKDLAIARTGGPLPVICTDEFTALRVAGRLGNRAARIFPLSTRRTAREHLASRDLPQYYASIAIKRHDSTKSFYFFFLDALVQFLSTEIETTATWWADLAGELTNTVAANLPSELDFATRWANAWEWVQYVMHLDRESIGAYNDSNRLPWQPILWRARNIIHHSFAARRDDLIVTQVTRALSDQEPASLRDLELLFDEKLDGPHDINGLVNLLHKKLGSDELMS